MTGAYRFHSTASATRRDAPDEEVAAKRGQRQQRNYLPVINSDSKAPDTDLLSLIRSFNVIVLKERGDAAMSVDIEMHSPISALLVALYLRNETPANDTEETSGGKEAHSIRLLFIFFYRAAYVTLEKAIINDNNRIHVSTIVD